MSSITWSKPFQQTSTSIDNRYWITNDTAIESTINNTPALILPAVTYRRKISIMWVHNANSAEAKDILLWINPKGGSVSLDTSVGHLWAYSGQNIIEWELSDSLYMATLATGDQVVCVVKTAILSN